MTSPFDAIFGERVHPSAFRVAAALQRLDESPDCLACHEAAVILRHRPAAEYATRLPTDAELEQVHESLTEVVDR